MKRYLLLLVCAACSGGIETFPVDAATDANDGSLIGSHNDGHICCIITKVEVPDSSLWGKGSEYDCKLDAALSGNPTDIPWVCNYSTNATTCEDPACVIGSFCEGVNGWGSVVECN